MVSIELEILKMCWIEHSKRIDEMHRIYPPEDLRIKILREELERIKIKINNIT